MLSSIAISEESLNPRSLSPGEMPRVLNDLISSAVKKTYVVRKCTCFCFDSGWTFAHLIAAWNDSSAKIIVFIVFYRWT